MNPSDVSMISQIISFSGTIIEIGLNSDFKLSGNSERPAYPGFIVINIANWSFNGISSESN